MRSGAPACQPDPRRNFSKFWNSGHEGSLRNATFQSMIVLRSDIFHIPDRRSKRSKYRPPITWK
ncbi:MAG TPA: hypothetical protein VHB02_13215 [Acidimicrobiales bacterium]|nr:hypothetical protein [Acidimicrobiales bacterium]